MGFGFEIERADGGVGESYSMNGEQMSIMRELMREVGAVHEAGAQRTFEDGPEPAVGAAPLARFQSNGGQLVTPGESRIIAERLREHRAIVHEVASFFDDAPYGDELDAWLNEWIGFNEQAARARGYRVR